MNKFQWNFNQTTKIFVHKNASENIVCKMTTIVSREHELIERYGTVSVQWWFMLDDK